jgi:2-dehydropantoate 2-reductase
MRFVIYGAGAIGGVIGARLHLAGLETVLFARGDHLRAIEQRGLEMQIPGDTLLLPIPAFASPSEIDFRPDDAVLLTMKSQDTEAALDDLRHAAGDAVHVVCVQNGVENERLALRRFDRVYGINVVVPASHLEPGVVATYAWPRTGLLDIGRYPRGSDAFCHTVAAALESAGFGSVVRDDIIAWKYTKLLQNTMNAIGAVCGPQAEAHDLVARAQAEAEACFAAAGIERVDHETYRRRSRDLRPPNEGPGGDGRTIGVPRPGGISSSTWQSLVRGAGSVEVDFLNGEIALLGRLHGVPTPVNAAFQVAAARLARERLPPGSITPEEMRVEVARREAMHLAGRAGEG